MMNSVAYAGKSLDQAFTLFNMVADGMTDEQYNFQPPGTSNTIAKSHVHAMSSVDFFVNALINSAPRQWPAFASEHGLPENPTEIWAHKGRISFAAMKEFSANVQKSVIEYVGTLTDDDLDREVDTMFFGKQTVAWLLMLSATHSMGHGGDMSAVKGIQGLKGLPF